MNNTNTTYKNVLVLDNIRHETSNKALFLSPLRQYLRVIEQEDKPIRKLTESETNHACLSKNPIAVMSIWETLIEAQKNTNFCNFMTLLNISESEYKGEITGWSVYKHKKPFYTQKTLQGQYQEPIDRFVYMPKTSEIDGFGREKNTLGQFNPYKSFKVSMSTVSRTMRLLEALDLEFVYSLVLTFPKEISNQYLETPEPYKIDIRLKKCFKEFVKWLRSTCGGQIGLNANLHIWSSMKPLNPHSHFHVLLLDRIIQKDGKEDQIKPFWFMKQNDRTKKWEETTLLSSIKKKWTEIVNSEFETQYQTIDLRIEFVELKKKDGSQNETGHRKLINKLKYNRRRPISDISLYYLFNRFSCNEIDDEFAEHLVHYKNKTSIFGYWNRMKKHVKKSIEIDKDVRCPICDEPLIYVSFCGRNQLPKDIRRLFVDRSGRFWEVSGCG